MSGGVIYHGHVSDIMRRVYSATKLTRGCWNISLWRTLDYFPRFIALLSLKTTSAIPGKKGTRRKNESTFLPTGWFIKFTRAIFDYYATIIAVKELIIVEAVEQNGAMILQ